MKLIDREPTPEMLKAITGADCAPSNYKRMFQTAYDAAPEVNQDPVAIVDANDEGYWADILPDRSVKVGQPLFAYPPEAQDEIAKRDDLIVELKTLHENEAFNTKYFKLHYEELGKEFSKQAERIKKLEEALIGYKADQAELIARDVEQASEIARLKGVIVKCGNALSRAAKARISTLRNADPDHEGYPYKSDEEVARIDGYTLPMLEALAAIKEEGL